MLLFPVLILFQQEV